MKEQKKTGMCGNLALTVVAAAILITLSGCDNNLTRPATGPDVMVPASADAQAKLVPYTDEKRISFAGRAPRAGRTLVFPRAQCKYALYMNYLHKYLDRPLFQDNTLWENDGLPNHDVMKYPSSRKTMDIVNSYDVDGLACIYAKGMDYGLPLFEYADRDGRDNFRVVPEFAGFNSKNIEAAFANNLKVVQTALASKSAARIDGKILITSYKASDATPEQWKEMLGRLREKVGNTFIFLPDVAGPAWGDYETFKKSVWKDPHYKEGVADQDRDNSVKEYLRVKERLRAYLEACDGLYFAYGHGLSKKDHTFAVEFYREAVASVFSSLKEDPQYKDKYFGLSAGLGHFNPGQGPHHSADGTRTLRRSFETALSINPDVIILPEWDEVNENTNIQPTVYRSFSTQRILKYYMSIIKRKLPSPNPGDDLGVPNLIVSYRKVLALGEKLELEILNVPDSKFSYPINCELALKDNSGQIVKQFPPFTLHPHKLQEERITIPTEDLRAYHILRPVLTVKAGAVTKTYELGLHHIRLYPTYNWDKLWVNQPLRDLADMRRADISAENAGAELLLKGALDCGEPLASVEILEGDDEIWAYDVDDEFSRDQDTVQILFTLRSHRRKDISGSIAALSKNGGITTPNTEAKWFRLSFFEFIRSRITGNELELTGNVDWWPTYKLDWLSRTSLLVLPRKDVTNTVLQVTTDLFEENIPVARIIANGIYAISDNKGATLTMEDYDRLPE
ncbi:MAG: hypothetical protein Q7J98_11210, partial [Kiritimatiellia bacterium]|nr:hypothetical protein [Kiritimatiellia bacterium]